LSASFSVEALVAHAPLALRLISGAGGLARTVHVPRIQKPGLALTGWPEQLHPGRVLVVGGTEIDYLQDNIVARTAGINTILNSAPACIVITRGLDALLALREACDERGVPLLVTELVTADFIQQVTAWMSDRLAPVVDQHGVLLDVLGIGVLLVGKSGIGKSETALDLVVRGHRLVADDVIQLRRMGAAVMGAPAGILGHHMEIRGLGIINIEDLFGISAVRPKKKVELVVELHEWVQDEEYDRLGFEDQYIDVLGTPVPKVRIPVRPGRNLATLVEVAARNQLLKMQGTNSAQAFRDTLNRAMEAQTDAVE